MLVFAIVVVVGEGSVDNSEVRVGGGENCFRARPC